MQSPLYYKVISLTERTITDADFEGHTECIGDTDPDLPIEQAPEVRFPVNVEMKTSFISRVQNVWRTVDGQESYFKIDIEGNRALTRTIAYPDIAEPMVPGQQVSNIT